MMTGFLPLITSKIKEISCLFLILYTFLPTTLQFSLYCLQATGIHLVIAHDLNIWVHDIWIEMHEIYNGFALNYPSIRMYCMWRGVQHSINLVARLKWVINCRFLPLHPHRSSPTPFWLRFGRKLGEPQTRSLRDDLPLPWQIPRPYHPVWHYLLYGLT
jgi:hypothetical protein